MMLLKKMRQHAAGANMLKKQRRREKRAQCGATPGSKTPGSIAPLFRLMGVENGVRRLGRLGRAAKYRARNVLGKGRNTANALMDLCRQPQSLLRSVVVFTQKGHDYWVKQRQKRNAILIASLLGIVMGAGQLMAADALTRLRDPLVVIPLDWAVSMGVVTKTPSIQEKKSLFSGQKMLIAEEDEWERASPPNQVAQAGQWHQALQQCMSSHLCQKESMNWTSLFKESLVGRAFKKAHQNDLNFLSQRGLFYDFEKKDALDAKVFSLQMWLFLFAMIVNTLVFASGLLDIAKQEDEAHQLIKTQQAFGVAGVYIGANVAILALAVTVWIQSQSMGGSLLMMGSVFFCAVLAPVLIRWTDRPLDEKALARVRENLACGAACLERDTLSRGLRRRRKTAILTDSKKGMGPGQSGAESVKVIARSTRRL